MSAKGYITAHAYTSYALLPLQNVALTVTAPDGTAIAMRISDRNGLIVPIEVPVPDKSASQSPDTGEVPFTTVNLYARLRGYEQIEIENLQVFAETVTLQDLVMIPLSELPGSWKKKEIFDTARQNL